MKISDGSGSGEKKSASAPAPAPASTPVLSSSFIQINTGGKEKMKDWFTLFLYLHNKAILNTTYFTALQAL